ncbi:MAG: hypothetical protein CMJ59_09720 [Planctomycetaceae bacterium]|nr:hypothetical protein [Planctomycetaceae bacterium]
MLTFVDRIENGISGRSVMPAEWAALLLPDRPGLWFTAAFGFPHAACRLRMADRGRRCEDLLPGRLDREKTGRWIAPPGLPNSVSAAAWAGALPLSGYRITAIADGKRGRWGARSEHRAGYAGRHFDAH